MRAHNAPVQPARRRVPAAVGLLGLLVVFTLAAVVPATGATGRADSTVLGGIAPSPASAVQPPGRQLAAPPGDGSETSPRPREPGCAADDGSRNLRPTRVGRSTDSAHHLGRSELVRSCTRSRAPPALDP